MELKDRIALARKQAGLSQEQLGGQLGVSRQAVSKWESGQANPDVTYIAAMCRLFGVSSDWLLLGEESAQTAGLERCPGCQTVVTGLDRFCPSCGRSLRGHSKPQSSYTLVMKKSRMYAASDLVRLSASGCFPEGSPLHRPLSQEAAGALAASAPLILATGLSRAESFSILDRMLSSEAFVILPGSEVSEDADPAVLAAQPGLSLSALRPEQREPLSFGMAVLAVIVGIVGGILLLSIL